MADQTRRCRAPAIVVAAALLGLGAWSYPAAALSEIRPEEVEPPAVTEPTPLPDLTPSRPSGAVPMPDAVRPPQQRSPDLAPAADEDETDPSLEGDDTGTAEPARPHVDPDAPVPEVLYDLSQLPAPARRMRELILAATKSGDIERLRPLLGMGDDATMLSFGDADGDLIAFLKQQSGDGEGHEILAILEEVLEAGFVHLDAGTPEDLYVWPYFFAVPIEKLKPPQRVELFRIVTAGDYEDMKNYGAYIFYRVGITPEGRWMFFVAGD
jgi:hypothetical protein